MKRRARVTARERVRFAITMRAAPIREQARIADAAAPSRANHDCESRAEIDPERAQIRLEAARIGVVAAQLARDR